VLVSLFIRTSKTGASAAGLSHFKESMHDNTLVEKSAVELRELIGSRQVSPVELLEACIARIEDLNPAHQCRHRHLLRARPPRPARPSRP
jgi:hypothetical protein